MSTTYAQKQAPAQKKDAPTAASILDASSQNESLQRKANLTNNVMQCVKFIGIEAKWHIHLEGRNPHIKFGSETQGRVDIYPESTRKSVLDNLRSKYNTTKAALKRKHVPSWITCWKWLSNHL